MSEFVSTSEAFRIARERASVATALEARVLHVAIFDARDSGMSIRATSRALSVPKSTVARHWRPGHSCPDVVPMWGSKDAWSEAHSMIWAHDPVELANEFIPYTWSDVSEDGVIVARSVTSNSYGTATMNTDLS